MTTIVPTDIVTVFTYSRGRHRAECSCGWTGRARWIQGSAVVDALRHSYDTGCREDWPLTVHCSGATTAGAPRRRLPWWVWTTTAGSIIGAALFYAPTARADAVDDYAATAYPVICEAIAEKPYVSTVVDVVDVIAVDTGSYEFAGAVLGVAVRDYCPWNRPPVERFIAVYLPTEPMAVA
ncbi:hypothetical protein [Mycolicibacterium sp. F2034L]|uniref:hypothetical protein n=1 Tax=Mycolicibacterium sp. F2034L TaxID=2926422 RepID=UPI001FF3692C|nr:hypothetical protein [Mycolicibacterium sp. F2034L]MCK0174773.1 hypothetical protein [Mycolicibacterium sp. F2034L]